MGLKQIASRLIPASLIRSVRLRKDLKQLAAAKRVEYKADSLRSKNDLSLSEIFDSHDIVARWRDTEKDLEQFTIPDGTGGVNPGDRRAIYYLISAIKPKSVLEIGTHIGASTIHIASALRKNPDESSSLTTVDIADVNSSIEKPWLEYGTSRSPIEMIEKLGCATLVDFITDTSLNYAAGCQRKFDFIFLDGSHSGATVYREIPVALGLLNPGGVILLHDYFPDMQPLWSNGSVIRGPFMATERLRAEGGDVTVLPLGELPWPTKLGSRVTSLALLLRNS